MIRVIKSTHRHLGSACRPSDTWAGDPSRHVKRRAAGKQYPCWHHVARHNPIRATRRLPQLPIDSSCGAVQPVSRTNGLPCTVEHRPTRGILARFRPANRICCLVQFSEPCWDSFHPSEVFPTYPDLSSHPDLISQNALIYRSVPIVSVGRERKSLFAWLAGSYGVLRNRFDSKSPDDLANRTKPRLCPCRSLPFHPRATAPGPVDPTPVSRPTHSADGRTRVVHRSAPIREGHVPPSRHRLARCRARVFRCRRLQRKRPFHLAVGPNHSESRLGLAACFWRRSRGEIAHKVPLPQMFFPQSRGDRGFLPLSPTTRQEHFCDVSTIFQDSRANCPITPFPARLINKVVEKSVDNQSG